MATKQEVQARHGVDELEARWPSALKSDGGLGELSS